MRLSVPSKVNTSIPSIYKNVTENLRNSSYFVGDKEDTASNIIEVKPPIPMSSCKYVFDNSSYVAKCCRILAKDIILNEITLISKEKQYDIVVKKIQDNLTENVMELYNMLIDYYYAGLGVVEYATGTHKFKLKQIPVNTTKIIRITIQGNNYYLLEQKIDSTVNYFRIMGENYPPNFTHFNKEPLGDCCLIGGDNFYQFFATPRWVQEKDKIFTEIAIGNRNYNTIINGNIATGILNINLEPQLMKPIQYKKGENGEMEELPSREEVISEELSNNDSGIAVIFTESNRPIKFDFTNIENNNYEYLEAQQEKAERSTLNCYNIPLARLMINTEKESMNSNKTQSIWEIYTLDLSTEQRGIKELIKGFILKLYGIHVDVKIELPIFSDRREIEINNILNEWDKGVLTLKQTITALAEYTSVIDLNSYDFTKNPDLWDYRQIPGYYDLLNEVDLLKLNEVEDEINRLS